MILLMCLYGDVFVFSVAWQTCSPWTVLKWKRTAWTFFRIDPRTLIKATQRWVNDDCFQFCSLISFISGEIPQCFAHWNSLVLLLFHFHDCFSFCLEDIQWPQKVFGKPKMSKMHCIRHQTKQQLQTGFLRINFTSLLIL